MPVRKYTYYDYTISLCPTCLKRIEAKIVFEDEKVYMLKTCPEHGFHKVVIATDVNYYKSIRNYNKPSETPLRFHNKIHYGCPYDCGLCTDHEQHSCLTLVEITDRCNLSCPTCYAMSSPHYGRHRTVEEVERMLDVIVASEGEPDVVQISGGEPTIHPHFFEILDIAKRKPIKHLMVNTNGIRIAQDPGFAERLASYMPDFELYLQFDSFRPEVLTALRGRDLTDIRTQALDKLNELNLSTTLVVTVQKGLNDDETGAIIDYALKQRCVRGVTFQPVQIAGRFDHDPATNRLTLSDVRKDILTQTNVFTPNDIIPVPCNPDALAMGYALKIDGKVFPLTRHIDPAALLDNTSRNTIVYEQDTGLHEKLINIFSTGVSVDKVSADMHQLLCCLPQVHAPGLAYENLFRIIIMRFIDAYDFDVRSIKKSCVHVVSKDGRIIPFETMNLFYRDDKEAALDALKNEGVFFNAQKI